MLADRVRKIAKEKKVPIYQIEIDCGIASGSISKWNDISPSWDKVQAVADRLGVDVSKLTTEPKE